MRSATGVAARDDGPALAAGDVLVVVEAEGPGIAQAAQPPALVAAADGLAGVLDHEQLVLARDAHDRLHVGGQAPHVHGDHGRASAGPIAASSAPGLRVIESSMSTMTGIAPATTTAIAVAM